MAKTFEVNMNRFPDNVALATTAAAIVTWLDSLSIGTSHTIYEISVEHKSGFWIVIVICEP